jgi:hypothetical protein
MLSLADWAKALHHSLVDWEALATPNFLTMNTSVNTVVKEEIDNELPN